jgi:hypothetical protein
MRTNVGIESKIKLPLTQGLSLLKYRSIKDGTVYNTNKALNVRGISSGTERSLGEIEVKLMTENHKTEHKFHVVGDGIKIPYDGILGKDFFGNKQATVDYMRREIFMVIVKLKFDD